MGVIVGVWIFVFTFLSKSLLVQSTIEINVGHFQMLGKHPQLRQCAEKVLHQNESVGGRISYQTGVCKGLPRVWARNNQTIEKGYAYVKRIHAHTTFQQTIGVMVKRWYIPGVLFTGAKVDVHLTTPKVDNWVIDIELIELPTVTHTEQNAYVVRFDSIFREVKFTEQGKDLSKGLVNERKIKLSGKLISSSVRFKISFVADGNSLQVLLDDELVERTSLSIIRVDYLTEVLVLSSGIEVNDDSSAVVNDFAFTEAKY